jgi:hypothetical protein
MIKPEFAEPQFLPLIWIFGKWEALAHRGYEVLQ